MFGLIAATPLPAAAGSLLSGRDQGRQGRRPGKRPVTIDLNLAMWFSSLCGHVDVPSVVTIAEQVAVWPVCPSGECLPSATGRSGSCGTSLVPGGDQASSAGNIFQRIRMNRTERLVQGDGEAVRDGLQVLVAGSCMYREAGQGT